MVLVPIFIIPFGVTFVATLLVVGAILSTTSDVFHLERTTGWLDAVKQLGAVVIGLGVPLIASVVVTRFTFRRARRVARRIGDRFLLSREDPSLIELMPEEVEGRWMNRASWRLPTLETVDPVLHEMLMLIAQDRGVIAPSCSAATMASGDWAYPDMSVRMFRFPTAGAAELREAFGAGDAETAEEDGWTLSRPAFDDEHPLARAIVMGEPWEGDIAETFVDGLAIYFYFRDPEQLALLLKAVQPGLPPEVPTRLNRPRR